VHYGNARTTDPYPVFVPEAGEFQLLSTTGPSWPRRRTSRARRRPAYPTSKTAEVVQFTTISVLPLPELPNAW